MSLRRTLTYGATSALLVAVLAAILVFANLLSARHYKRFDTTANQRFTLSPQTVKVLAGLAAPVEALAFFEPDGKDRQEATQLFEQARAASRDFTFRFIDPDKHPREAQAHGITQYGTTVLKQGERTITLSGHDEGDLTSGLIRVSRRERRQVRFTTGHGERPLHGSDRDGFDAAARALAQQGFEVSELLLLQTGAVPEGTDVVVIAGPKKPFLAEEVAAIHRYLDGGGDVILLADPDGDADLAPLVKGWGVTLPKELIIDPSSRMFGGDYTVPLVAQYPPHAITQGFSLACFFPVARPVVEGEAKGVTHAVIAKTGDQAWGETEIAHDPIRLDDADRKGPVDVILLSERAAAAGGEAEAPKAEAEEDGAAETESPAHGGRLLVAGDADFPTNQWFQFSGNGDLFLNCVSWMGKEEGLVSIRAKEHQAQTLALTPRQGEVLLFGFVIFLPLATFAVAFGVWRWRRSL
jgi:ABC-type uncharacterized transport system involved in gliding motility auxiliary subunit